MMTAKVRSNTVSDFLGELVSMVGARNQRQLFYVCAKNKALKNLQTSDVVLSAVAVTHQLALCPQTPGGLAPLAPLFVLVFSAIAWAQRQ